jgi:hypothetical protein
MTIAELMRTERIGYLEAKRRLETSEQMSVGLTDHDEVRCDTKVVGEPRTCCVCVGHDCQAARDEMMRVKTATSP